jgi:tryptophan-rich sensory protein
MNSSKKVNINWKLLIKNLAIPLLTGIVSGFATRGANEEFSSTAIQPEFTPPAFLFPIVWTILYILMGISAYLIEITPFNTGKKNRALITYYISLLFNFSWSFIFFGFGLYFFAFVWLVILLGLVILYTFKYLQINKTAGYLNLPYIIWLIFAGILNFYVFLLN